MHANAGVVLVSNRGPASFAYEGDNLILRRGGGGLGAALDPAARRLGERVVWIAAATSEAERAALAAGAGDELSRRLGYPVRLLDLDDDTYTRYYEHVSNRMLWFAAHGLWGEIGEPSLGKDDEIAFTDAYDRVNRAMAEAAVGASAPGALVLFQDYHLATAPAHARALAPDLVILHFTHASFAPPDALRRLPDLVRRRVLEGMMSADLVAFHVGAWAENFYNCCVEIGAQVDPMAGRIEHQGRQCWVRTYPLPVDARVIAERARSERASTWAARLDMPGRITLVRADRAELSKNIVRGFAAWEALLDRRPDLRRARFVACIYPSRTGMPEYRAYTEAIRRAVVDVEERHPGSVELLYGDDFDRTLGAYRIYDALLVNSIRDGMNLVSKEGPLVNERDGVLVLSRSAGSFEELGVHAIEIGDPYDVEETAAAIETALELDPAERARRAAALRAAAASGSPASWIEAQLADLHAIRDGAAPVSPAPRAAR